MTRPALAVGGAPLARRCTADLGTTPGRCARWPRHQGHHDLEMTRAEAEEQLPVVGVRGLRLGDAERVRVTWIVIGAGSVGGGRPIVDLVVALDEDGYTAGVLWRSGQAAVAPAPSPPNGGAIIEVDPRALLDSPRNPRGPVADEDVEDLAASIREVGLLEPLVVRPIGEVPETVRWEVICGHRRKRAAILAGLETVRCVVRDLDDREALLAGLAENSQRRDVHPLDESRALVDLRNRGLDVGELATRLGRTERWVRDRLDLDDLDLDLAALLRGGTIGLRSAVMLAHLPGERQAELVGRLPADGYASPYSHTYVAREAQTAARRLDSAPWSADLAAGRGTCAGCPMRTDSQPSLLDDLGEDSCLDGVCWTAHAEAWRGSLAAQLGCEVVTQWAPYGRPRPTAVVSELVTPAQRRACDAIAEAAATALDDWRAGGGVGDPPERRCEEDVLRELGAQTWGDLAPAAARTVYVGASGVGWPDERIDREMVLDHLRETGRAAMADRLDADPVGIRPKRKPPTVAALRAAMAGLVEAVTHCEEGSRIVRMRRLTLAAAVARVSHAAQDEVADRRGVEPEALAQHMALLDPELLDAALVEVLLAQATIDARSSYCDGLTPDHPFVALCAEYGVALPEGTLRVGA